MNISIFELSCGFDSFSSHKCRVYHLNKNNDLDEISLF